MPSHTKAPSPVEVVQVGHEHLAQLQDLWRADYLEAHPGDERGATQAAADLRASLDHHDFLRSDSFWLFAAHTDGRFVGYATVARVPKADHHLLFLFLDELFVLRAYRRQGVADALLTTVLELGGRLGAQGVRLIVDPGNTAARHLYQASGFTEAELIFCRRSLR